MTIIEWLMENMVKLSKAGVDSPRRDCLVLLEDTLRKDRAWVISHPAYPIQRQSLKALNGLILQRLQRKPLAYIRSKAWFYGRFFNVSNDVMIPRPESEAFIELLKDLNPDEVIDIGTGSGCLAISAKLEIPDCSVFGYDIDPKTLKIAKKNALKHHIDIEFKISDLLTSVKMHRKTHDREKSDTALMVNLPYVPENLVTSPEILFEPKQALFSGNDGLDHYRTLWRQVSDLSLKPQHILTESLEKQHIDMVNLSKDAGYALKRTKILVQHFEYN